MRLFGWWRKRSAPAGRDSLEIMREATQLRNEIRLRPGYDRMVVIERRMRELAVEIGALPADALAPSPVETREDDDARA